MRSVFRLCRAALICLTAGLCAACGDEEPDVDSISDADVEDDSFEDVAPNDAALETDAPVDAHTDATATPDTTVPDAGDTDRPDVFGPQPVDYGDIENWLCHPDNEADPCDADHSFTVVEADGSGTVVSHTPAPAPAVDCFYVYPTASADARPNSDLRPGVEEAFVARTQVGPLNQVCRVFAPVYRQVTLTGLLGIANGDPDRELGYGDVLNAWKYYLANENDGRGVILVGHSQGTSVLRRLIAEEIETDDTVYSLLVAAYLFGGSIEVPVDGEVGGSFARTPPCRVQDQVGCVVSFATFAATAPPPEDSYFGRASEGNVALCNPPGGLDGESAPLGGRYPTEIAGLFGIAAGNTVSPYDSPDAYPALTTENFALADYAFGACRLVDGISYLEVSLVEGSGDVRIREFPSGLGPQWGLHLLDVFFVMNDLVAMAERQAAAWLER